MADTTNLTDLPTDPTVGGGGQNVVLQTTEKPSQYNPNMETTSTSTEMNKIDEQKMMNEFVSGIQQASASGATNLPSRDIPQNTVHFADEQTKANFVPEKEQSDYIHVPVEGPYKPDSYKY